MTPHDLLTCHGCLHEWAEACDERHVHLPSDNLECQTCSRNPKPKLPKGPIPTVTRDNFLPMDKALKLIEKDC